MFLVCFLMIFQLNTGEISITISGIEKQQGYLRIGLYANSQSYLKKSLHYKDVKVLDKDQYVVSFKDISWGTYVVSIYHDINENKILDTNFLKIPKEPYGFSQNPRTTFGPPSFDKASFVHNNSSTQIEIEL